MKEFLKKIVGYLNPAGFFSKKNKDVEMNLRFMHGINRISILVFIICLIVMAIKFIF